MGSIIQFPAHLVLDLQPVKAVYTCREISELFGLTERTIRRWVKEGLVCPVSAEDLLFDFNALPIFRRVRDLRAQGLSQSQIEVDLRGQMHLFERSGDLLELPLNPFKKGLQLQEQGDHEAAAYFHQAIDQGQYVADAFCNLAILEFEGGQTPSAISLLTLALKQDPRHFESHFNLGNVYFDASNYRLAQLHFEVAREIEGNFPNLHYNLGLTYALQDDLDRARESLREHLRLAPDVGELTGRILAQIELALELARGVPRSVPGSVS
jgi:tetratricopeptide (TPR) repeat protein